MIAGADPLSRKLERNEVPLDKSPSKPAGKLSLDELGEARILGQGNLVRISDQIQIAISCIGILAEQLHQTAGLKIVVNQERGEPRDPEAVYRGSIDRAAEADEAGRRNNVELLVVDNELPMRMGPDDQTIMRLQVSRMIGSSMSFEIDRGRANRPGIGC